MLMEVTWLAIARSGHGHLFIDDISFDKETFYLVGLDYNNLGEVISSYSPQSSQSFSAVSC